MKSWLYLGLGLALVGFANTSLAFFDAEALIGRRSGQYDDGSTKSSALSTNLNLSAHLDPIPLVPVAFGVFLETNSFKVSDDASETLKGVEGGPEIMAWLPIPGVDLKPYAKLGYSVYGAYKISGDVSGAGDVSGTGTSSGAHIGLGFMYPVVPLVAFLFQVDFANEKFKTTKLTVGGLDVTDKTPNTSFNTTAVMLGAQVGL